MLLLNLHPHPAQSFVAAKQVEILEHEKMAQSHVITSLRGALPAYNQKLESLVASGRQESVKRTLLETENVALLHDVQDTQTKLAQETTRRKEDDAKRKAEISSLKVFIASLQRELDGRTGELVDMRSELELCQKEKEVLLVR